MRVSLLFILLALTGQGYAAPAGPLHLDDLWALDALDMKPAEAYGAAFGPCADNANLLAGKKPHRSNNAHHVDRLTDNQMPEKGGQWDSALTSQFKGSSAFVTYDLGEIVPISALLLQGDNNDKYEISVSDDGRVFRSIWTAPMHPHGGMQTRLAQNLGAWGRYLRIGFPTGDDSYSIGELQAYCAQPDIWPPPVTVQQTKKTQKNSRKHKMGRGKIAFGIIGLIALLGLLFQGSDPRIKWLLPTGAAALIIYVTYYATLQLKHPKSESWIMGAVLISLVGLVWLWRNQDVAGRWKWGERGALVAIILSSAVTWVNFGTFHGSRKVHYWDSFHYYVGSKYFKENGYSLLYKCAALSEVDDGRSSEVYGRKMRDLTDNKLRPAKIILKDHQDCREAFTPKRWAAFQQDLRLFRAEMGGSWWQKMFKDHGYNPTPVWNLVGSTLTNFGWEGIVPPEDLVNSPANLKGRSAAERKAIRERFKQDKATFNNRIERFALLDASLYIGLFLLLGWAFGLRVMAFSMMVWASGYPWAYFWTGGGYGRVPWLFFAVAGVALLKKGYYALGGWSITWSALHRVFPAALAGGVTLQIIITFIKERRLTKSQLRIMLGATLALGILIPMSVPVAGGFDAYPKFLQNSLKHKSTPLTNNMGLQTVLSYHPKHIARKTKTSKFKDPFKIWKVKRKENFKNRRWLYVGILAGLFALIGWMGRRVPAWEVTAMSTIFLMTIFELTCYYYNFIILMAPLAFRRPASAIVLLVTTIIGQWLQLRIGWYDEQYTWESMLVLGAALFILLERAYELYRAERDEAEPPSEEKPIPQPT